MYCVVHYLCVADGSSPKVLYGEIADGYRDSEASRNFWWQRFKILRKIMFADVDAKQVLELYWRLPKSEREAMLVRILRETPVTLIVGGENDEPQVVILGQRETTRILGRIVDRSATS